LAVGLTLSGRTGRGDERLLSTCTDADEGLAAVASELARHEIAANDIEGVTYALRAAGEPHVWPRAITLEARAVDRLDARARIDKWLAAFRHRGHLRCAVASAAAGDKETIAAVAVDAQADMDPVAVTVRPSSWVDVAARVLVPASGAKVVVLGPTGVPRTVPTTFTGGRVRASAMVDRVGTWIFQVVLDADGGPRPVLESFVFAGVPVPPRIPAPRAPGEDVAGDGPDALAAMVTYARSSVGLAPLESSRALDRVARAHADRMMRASDLAHDVGDGDVRQRVEDAGIDAANVGENVAHAATLALAHRALWASPSHRDNLLNPHFTHLGVGVARGPDGTVWVTELFATGR
jgi:hypothetical protein